MKKLYLRFTDQNDLIGLKLITIMLLTIVIMIVDGGNIK